MNHKKQTWTRNLHSAQYTVARLQTSDPLLPLEWPAEVEAFWLQSVVLRKPAVTYFLRPRERNSTFYSSVCANRAQFGWVGADAAQGRRCESLSGEKRSLLLGRSVVGSVRGCVRVAGRGILGRVVVGNAVLRVRHWFCLESRVRKTLLLECEHNNTRCRCAVLYPVVE